jgi:DNA-binding YbaB/EbfC family protein
VDPFDMGNLGALLGGFQQKMQEMKDRMANARMVGEAGGGMVKVTLTGDNRVESVEIAEGAMEDRELLEDLVRAAMSEALRKVKDDLEANMRQLTGGLPIPPGMLPF